jgi:hypothetical protein
LPQPNSLSSIGHCFEGKQDTKEAKRNKSLWPVPAGNLLSTSINPPAVLKCWL